MRCNVTRNMCITLESWCTKCKVLLERDRDHAKKAELTDNRIAFEFSAQYGCRNELMRCLIYMAFKRQLLFFYGDLAYEHSLCRLACRIRLLRLQCVTR